MSDTFFSEIDTHTAVSACQRVSEDINNSLRLLSYQLSNCQKCKINLDCDWSMRRIRLQSGKCAYIKTA